VLPHHLRAVEWARYDKVPRFYHREHILQHFGVRPFEQTEAAVRQQVTHFARQKSETFSASW